MEQFISGSITPAYFEDRFIRMFLRDKRMFPQAIFDILQDLFYYADMFTPNPDRPDDVSGDELLVRCRTSYGLLLGVLDA
jgi:hypothetical protein